MKDKDIIVNVKTFTISMDEFKNIFPWFEELSEEKVEAHHVSDKAIEMKSS
jgi:hypothetical protein